MNSISIILFYIGRIPTSPTSAQQMINIILLSWNIINQATNVADTLSVIIIRLYLKDGIINPFVLLCRHKSPVIRLLVQQVYKVF